MMCDAFSLEVLGYGEALPQEPNHSTDERCSYVFPVGAAVESASALKEGRYDPDYPVTGAVDIVEVDGLGRPAVTYHVEAKELGYCGIHFPAGDSAVTMWIRSTSETDGCPAIIEVARKIIDQFPAPTT